MESSWARHPPGAIAWLALASAAGGAWGCVSRPTDSERASGNTVAVLYPSDIGVFGPRWDDSPKFLLFLPLVNYEGGLLVRRTRARSRGAVGALAGLPGVDRVA